MTTEKPPAPWWRVRTSSGTPPIQVPEAIVSAIASTITAAARTGSGRSAAKPSRIRGGSSAVDTAVLRRIREINAADTANDAALRAKNALIGRTATSPAATAQ